MQAGFMRSTFSVEKQRLEHLLQRFYSSMRFQNDSIFTDIFLPARFGSVWTGPYTVHMLRCVLTHNDKTARWRYIVLMDSYALYPLTSGEQSSGFNPVTRDFVLMCTTVNLWNRVPEHDCSIFFVLQRTKCKPMHSAWERFSDVFVLHRTKCKPMHFWRGAFFRRECAQTVQCTL
jgi:hypothetical protein